MRVAGPWSPGGEEWGSPYHPPPTSIIPPSQGIWRPGLDFWTFKDVRTDGEEELRVFRGHPSAGSHSWFPYLTMEATIPWTSTAHQHTKVPRTSTPAHRPSRTPGSAGPSLPQGRMEYQYCPPVLLSSCPPVLLSSCLFLETMLRITVLPRGQNSTSRGTIPRIRGATMHSGRVFRRQCTTWKHNTQQQHSAGTMAQNRVWGAGTSS